MKKSKREIKAMAANRLSRMARMLNHAVAIESGLDSGRRFRPNDASLLRRRAERCRKAYQRLHGMAASF